MNKIKLIIRLHFRRNGSRSISNKVGLSRNTVKKYPAIFHRSGRSYEAFFKKSDSEIAKLFEVSENLYVPQ
jgi:hypothetical protein